MAQARAPGNQTACGPRLGGHGACLAFQSPELGVIAAVRAFAEGDYETTIRALDALVTEGSPPLLKLVYGLAHFYARNPWDGKVWVDAAVEDAPASHIRSIAERVTRALDHHPPRLELGPEPRELLHGAGGALLKAVVAQSVPHGAGAYAAALCGGDLASAYRLGLRDNPFAATLAAVAPRPCAAPCFSSPPFEPEHEEPSCWVGLVAAAFSAQKPVRLKSLFASTGQRVGIVGGGAAGLAVARDLALLGHAVTVYERESLAGGRLVARLPAYRVAPEVVAREIAQVHAQGVTIRCGVEVGTALSLKQLLKMSDAVVLATGTSLPRLPRLPGLELRGVCHSLDYLPSPRAQYGTRGDVVVIGGGLTAVDCAHVARLAASGKVHLLYEGEREDMNVTAGEIGALEAAGVTLGFGATPEAILGDSDGNVRAVRWRPTPRTVDPPEQAARELPCCTVLLATGQTPDTWWIDARLRRLVTDRTGAVKDAGGTRTGHMRIFMAGDFALGTSPLGATLAHARQCVREVDRFLTGRNRLGQPAPGVAEHLEEA